MRWFWPFAIALLTAGVCDPVVEDACPDLADFCPDLGCVERARADNGCPLCECVVQACLQASDCAPQTPALHCNLAPTVCEPAPACTDGDDATLCPAACFGRCDVASDFCDSDADCSGSCRFDQRFCVVDQGRCRGWCVEACDEVLTLATDPQSQTCFEFADSCVPPTFTPGCR